MRQHRRTAYKVRQGAHGFLGGGCASNVYVTYACEALNLGRDWPARINKGLKTLNCLAARDPCGRYLYELAVLEREARSLRIEHHDILFEQVKRMGACPLGKTFIVGANVLGRSRKKQPLEGGCSSFHVLVSLASTGKSHAIPPTSRELQAHTPQTSCRARGTQCRRGGRNRAGGYSRSCQEWCWSRESPECRPRAQ